MVPTEQAHLHYGDEAPAFLAAARVVDEDYATRFFSSRSEFFRDCSRISFFIGPGTKKPTSATMSTVTSVEPSSRGAKV